MCYPDRMALPGITFIFVSDDDDLPSWMDRAVTALVKASPINILRGKELTVIAKKGTRQVAGVLYTEFDGEFFSFDVIVDPQHGGAGLGSALTDLGLRSFTNDYAEMGATLELDAVNPAMVAMLLRRGLVITRRHGDHTLMRLPD